MEILNDKLIMLWVIICEIDKNIQQLNIKFVLGYLKRILKITSILSFSCIGNMDYFLQISWPILGTNYKEEIIK